MAFCLDCNFRGCCGKVGLGVVPEPSVSLCLSCGSDVINTTAKLPSLPFLVTAWTTTDIYMVSGIGTCHRPQHSLQWQPTPRKSSWPSVVSRAMNINTVSGCSRTTMGPNMALAGSMDHRHQHGLRWLHMADVMAAHQCGPWLL